MAWKRVSFKGKKVWCEVDATGALISVDGRSPIRYSDKEGAKIYHAYTNNITIEEGETPTSMPKGKSLNKSLNKLGSSKTRTEEQKVRAQQVARDLVNGLSAETVVCFTDGACRGNPGPAGAGVFMKVGKQEYSFKKYLGVATNNVAELTAIELALQAIQEKEIADDVPVAVLTDSKYSHGVLTLNWKAKSNRTLIMKLRSQIRSRGNIKIHWVAGHAGIEENEQADLLANQAISEQS